MPRPRTSRTRERILDTALELFARQGVRATSLREVAERLGVTKPALYYHFESRDALVRALVQPLIDDVEAMLAEDEAAWHSSPRELLTRYFDISHRHRRIILLMTQDLATVDELGVVQRIVSWRSRLAELLVGSGAGTADRARAVVALGGLGDCIVLLGDVDEAELRAAAVDAACSALGVA